MSVANLNFGGARRVRPLRQTEVADCGLACLAMIATYHGLAIDVASLRRRFPITERGMSLKGVMASADGLGLSPRAVKLPLEALGKLHLPAVLHWGMNHFVVLDAVTSKGVRIHDPSFGTRHFTMAEVSKLFTGVALELRPAAHFEPADSRVRLRLSSLWSRMVGLKRAIGQVLLLSLVLQVFVLAIPYYMQVSIDTALPAVDRDLLVVLALGFGLLTLFSVGATLLRSFVLLQVGTIMSYQIASNLARRLFRLPISYFERRHVGDVLTRFQSVQPIRDALTQGVAAGLVDGTMAVLTLIVMALYSPLLTVVAVTAFVLYLGVRATTFSIERERREGAIAALGKEQSLLIETLRGMTTLRMFGRETERHAMWQNRLTDSTNAALGQARVGVWQTTANTTLFGLENVVSIFIAVRLAMDGGFTVGMIFAFMAYKLQFVQKAAALVDQAIAFRMLSLHLERLADIALEAEDPSFGPNEGLHQELRGGLDLRNLSYRYGPTEPLVLSDLQLSVAPGEHLAITGPSGGGKSTLMKIMLGLIEADSGEMLVDGMPLERFGIRSYRGQVAGVLQDDQLFAGSIADNITFFDPEPDIERLERASRNAAIDDEIKAMPMRYETLVGDMGAAMSGGQKQRVLLARALYREPKILFMDEGTAHLDAATEAHVNRSIAQLGITRVIVAHRSETIRNADRVLVLTGGRLHPAERGEALVAVNPVASGR